MGLPSTLSSKELTSTASKHWRKESSTTWTPQAGEQATVRLWLLRQSLCLVHTSVSAVQPGLVLPLTCTPCFPCRCSMRPTAGKDQAVGRARGSRSSSIQGGCALHPSVPMMMWHHVAPGLPTCLPAHTLAAASRAPAHLMPGSSCHPSLLHDRRPHTQKRHTAPCRCC